MDKHICYTIETQAGFVPLATSGKELLWLYLPVQNEEAAQSIIKSECGDISVEHECNFAGLGNLLKDYFNGKLVDFSSVPVDVSCTTDFGRSVLKELQIIPYGCVVGYGELAEIVGSPRAARAVGTVVGHNRTPVILPCHRVIAAGHKIGGFSAGLDWKYRLLDIEGIQI